MNRRAREPSRRCKQQTYMGREKRKLYTCREERQNKNGFIAMGDELNNNNNNRKAYYDDGENALSASLARRVGGGPRGRRRRGKLSARGEEDGRIFICFLRPPHIIMIRQRVHYTAVSREEVPRAAENRSRACPFAENLHVVYVHFFLTCEIPPQQFFFFYRSHVHDITYIYIL